MRLGAGPVTLVNPFAEIFSRGTCGADVGQAARVINQPIDADRVARQIRSSLR